MKYFIFFAYFCFSVLAVADDTLFFTTEITENTERNENSSKDASSLSPSSVTSVSSVVNNFVVNNLETMVLTLQGYLSQEEVAQALKKLEVPSLKQLVLQINSTSGNLTSVFDLAKKIYELKIEKQIKVIVYINENAIGPAAMLPFLSDELYISVFVSWGDIPLGSENALSTNILRNRVVSLISARHSHAALFALMAAAMADPSVRIVDDHGWRLAVEGKDNALPAVTSPGQPLVVNQNQLQDLALVNGVMPLDKFHERFHLEKIAQEAIPVSSTLAIPQKTVDEELSKHIVIHPKGANKVGWIGIDNRNSEINQGTWLYVKNALDYYKENKPDFIILHINTPGGEVFAAEQISDALKNMDTQFNIPTVAYIDNWAMSAGALLAYSCRFIAIVKDASMGAAEPLTMEGTETKVASEKVNSALRADFANRAAFFGRNPNIAEGMVDKDIILVLRHGNIIKVDTEDQIRKTGPDPDILIKAKGKLLTLNANQLMEYGVADIFLNPTKLEALTPQDEESGKWPAKKTLLFTYPFFEKIPQAQMDVYKMDWKTRFFVILANPVVSSLLFLGMVLGFYVEFNGGGFGVAGTVAVTCLFLIMLSSFAQEIANWLEVILLLTGLMVILVELFVLPTFGLLGFIGIIFFLVGLFGMMLPGAGSISYEFDTRTFNAAGEAFIERLAWLCGTLILAFVIMILLSRYLKPTWSGFRKFVLSGHEQEGYTAAGDDISLLPKPGAEGVVLSTLRPAGKVLINDQVYEALTAGSFIEKGERIIVQGFEGSVVLVKKVES